jgi:hypothetical protein
LTSEEKFMNTALTVALTALAFAGGPSSEQWTTRLAEVREQLPSKDFTIIRQSPFIVVGDEAPETVKARARGTVKWAVDHLKELYFDRDPEEVLVIWLFADRKSYRTNAETLFGSIPDTPYGYYSSYYKALVMNIATGGGTLVHEIVHPFMRANFPKCPAWFNEGMGSLYEQSAERNGRIVGLTNWRLAGLQVAITNDLVPSFGTLLSTTEDEFYNDDPGTNYAQARYLCYYLQEKDLLVDFYKAFHKAHTKDPTGQRTLQKILGTDDLPKFQKEWQKWVMELSFPS